VIDRERSRNFRDQLFHTGEATIQRFHGVDQLLHAVRRSSKKNLKAYAEDFVVFVKAVLDLAGVPERSLPSIVIKAARKFP
jgi:hypothetical protein